MSSRPLCSVATAYAVEEVFAEDLAAAMCSFLLLVGSNYWNGENSACSRFVVEQELPMFSRDEIEEGVMLLREIMCSLVS
ncbi:hypothetical protein Nepgr_003949 [Nepenthes gracilis]|uniref:Uncharacterized protein n=1 Tax=Nepenthes gracilis TaxID=150966 RepID=A0AAD3S0G6_NEPGR|nr:hypothetical protein Nepgr_003949 [Nepenthes gracilis]